MDATDKLTPDEFRRFKTIVAKHGGIFLPPGKETMVLARMRQRLSDLSLTSFQGYLEQLEKEDAGPELIHVLNLISTNVTYFFRETQHFEYLKKVILPTVVKQALERSHRLRLWSAGCSSGEEVYSLAITIREASSLIKGWDIKILGTDISTRVLHTARHGCYALNKLVHLGADRLKSHFRVIKHEGKRSGQVIPSIRRMVDFARMNLVQEWPVKGPFDIIFCRNVMIYFNDESRQTLVRRFWEILNPGGWLIIGHAESLQMIRHQFKYVEPTIYRKL